MRNVLNKFKVGLIAILSLVTILAPVVAVYAEDGGEEEEEKHAIWLQISPVSNRVFIGAGQSMTYNMNVDNIGTDKFKFRVYAVPYSVENDNYDVSFTNENTRTQISRWISFNDGNGEFKDEVSFELESGSRQTVEYKITTPEDVPAGGQYATIFAETIPSDDKNITGIQTVSRVGLIIYGRTDGETRESVKLEDPKIATFMTSGKVGASVKVVDDGNTDFQAHATISVKNSFGNEVYNEEKDFDVLPDTTRKISLEWEETPSIGFFQVYAKFTALGETYEATKLVAVVPLFVIIIMLILLTILIAWIIILVKKRKSQKSRLIV